MYSVQYFLFNQIMSKSVFKCKKAYFKMLKAYADLYKLIYLRCDI